MIKLNQIVKQTKLCTSLVSQTLGLMFTKQNPDKALIFKFKKEKHVPLHMFFVFYPIDILYLDKNKKVVEIKENFRPFTFYSPKNKAQYIIELPKNKIKENKIKLKQNIHF